MIDERFTLPPSRPHFLDLPIDICVSIFSTFPKPKEILTLKLVCYYFHEVSESKMFPWRNYCFGQSLLRRFYPDAKTFCRDSWECGWECAKASDACTVLQNSIAFSRSEYATVVCRRAFTESDDGYFWRIKVQQQGFELESKALDVLSFGVLDEVVFRIYPKKHFAQSLDQVGYGVVPSRKLALVKGALAKRLEMKTVCHANASVYSFYLDMKKRQLCMWRNDVYFGPVFDGLPRSVRPAVSGKGLVRMEAHWNARMSDRQREQLLGLDLGLKGVADRLLKDGRMRAHRQIGRAHV